MGNHRYKSILTAKILIITHFNINITYITLTEIIIIFMELRGHG